MKKKKALTEQEEKIAEELERIELLLFKAKKEIKGPSKNKVDVACALTHRLWKNIVGAVDA